MTEPLPVLPLEYAPPPPATRQVWRRIARVCAAGAWPCCAIAWGLVVAGMVESVLFTGPVIFTLGVLTLLGGAFNRDRWAIMLGAGHCAVCVLFFFLVNAFDWSPRDAKLPFTVMGAAYTFLVSPVPTVLVVRGRPPAPLPEAHPSFHR